MTEAGFTPRRTASPPVATAVPPPAGHRAKGWPWAVASGAVLLILLLYSLGSPGSPPAGQTERPVTGGPGAGLGNAPDLSRSSRPGPPSQRELAASPTVYITRTSNHYHRAGCR